MEDRAGEYCRHSEAVMGLACSCLLLSDAGRPGGEFCHACRYEGCRALSTHLYGCHEAYRWNGQYIYYCPIGLVFIAASLSRGQEGLTGALIAGPCLMGRREDALADLSGLGMEEAASALPDLSPADVRHRAALLTAVASYCSEGPRSRPEALVYEQARLFNDMYISGGEEDEGQMGQKLIDFENQLRALVISGDRAGAQSLLNELLGRIYFYSSFQLETIRTRMIELAVILSRATIEAGADVGQVFLLNSTSLRDVAAFSGLEELSVWLSSLMHRFISYSFDMPSVRHSDAVHRVIHYIREHLSEKLTLDELARQAYLSRTYLSGIFKAQTGMGLSAYVTSARVRRAKKLLREGRMSLSDVAAACGFEDQSYFTRVFRRQVGVSPKRYRDGERGSE